MKVKFSKRLLSFFLAILMIITTIPAFSLTVSAAEEAKDKFLFAYFTGDHRKEQTVKYAVSEDGINFEKVNDGAPVIVQTLGSRSCRDPYIAQAPDGTYYCIATDMNVGEGESVENGAMGWWGNGQNSFIVWKSTDLINWSDETRINLSEILGVAVNRCWAPQFAWDAVAGKFMVYLSIAADGYAAGETGYNTHIYYMYTDDLMNQSSYSKPEPIFNKCDTTTKDNIDGEIVDADGQYYMFFKDEANATICVAKSTNGKINGPYDLNNVIKLNAGDSVGALEGCQVYKNNNGEYIYIADRYAAKGSFAVYNFGKDLAAALGSFPTNNSVTTLDITGRKVSSNIENVNHLGARHGSVINITTAQYNAIKSAEFNAYDLSTAEGEGVDLTNDLIARYFVNDTTTDETGNGHSLTAAGTVNWENKAYDGMFGVASFTDGNYLYTDQFKNMMNGKTGFSVSFLANTDMANDNNGRLFETTNHAPKAYTWTDGTTTNKLLSVLANDSKGLVTFEGMTENYTWNDGRFGTSYTAPGYNSWHHYTFTYDSSTQTISMYQDAEKKFTLTFAKFNYDNLMKELSYLIIGATSYPDKTYTGMMRDFRVYGRAIDETEAINLTAQYYKNMQDQINSVAKTFEETVKGLNPSKHYTGLAEAYEAYVAYNKALDSYKYGGRTDIDLNQYITNLRVATEKIAEATTVGYKTSITSKIPQIYNTKDNRFVDAPESTYRNILFTDNKNEDFSNVNRDINNNDKNVTSYLRYPVVTMLYDGSDEGTYSPILMKYYSKKNARWIISAVIEDERMSLTQNWKGKFNNGDNWDYAWFMTSSDCYDIAGNNTAQKSLTTQLGNSNTWGRTTGVGNIMKFTGQFSDGDYYYDVPISVMSYFSGSNNYNYSDINQRNTSNYPIHVINYKAYLDAVKTIPTSLTENYSANAQNYFTNIANYKQGGLTGFLNANELTNFDVESYFTSSNDYQGCADAIKTYVEKIKSTTFNEVTADNADYQDIRNVFDNKSIPKQYSLGNTGYTADSWTAFESAYESAQSVMNVLDTGYTHTDAAAYATNLQTAYDNLELDFTPVDASALSDLITKVENNLLSNNNADYFKTPEKLQEIITKIDEAKATVWANGEYGLPSSLIEDSAGNRAKVTSYVDAITALVGELTVNFDYTYKANGGSYSVNSALNIKNSLHASDYSNYAQFETADNNLVTAKNELNSTAVTVDNITAIIEKYDNAIENIVAAYRALTYAFTMIPDGTVANRENNKAITQLNRDDTGKSYVDFSYTPKAVIFKTTRDAQIIPYGEANITFTTDIVHDNNALDSISLNAQADAIGDKKRNIYNAVNKANPRALTNEELAKYAGSLTNGAFALTDIYYTGRNSANNASPILTKNDGTQITFEPTALQTELSPIIGVTDGSDTSPVKGAVFARKNGSNGAAYMTAKMTVSVPATEKATLSADTQPTKTTYTTGESNFGALVSFHVQNGLGWNYAGYSWLTTKQNNETIRFDADVIDITNLIDLVGLASSVSKDDYSSGSYKTLQTALDAARADMNYTSMTSDEILTACQERYTNLWNAYQALVDVTVYRASIKEYNSIKSDSIFEYMYSPESRNAYITAVQNAMIDEETANQSQVDTANTKIAEAKSLLQLSTLKAVVQFNDKTTTLTATYGELFTFDPAVLTGNDLDGASITWSVDLYKPGSDLTNPESAQKVGTQKQTTVGTEAFTRYANCDIVMSAKIKHNAAAAEQKISLRVYNGYGNLIDIMTVDKPADGSDFTQVNVGTLGLPEVSMPFYTFEGWKQPVKVSENVYKISPMFNVDRRIVIDTVINGNITDSVTVETNGSNNVTVSTNDSTQIYGWVVKSGDYYQIVSYADGESSDFKFVAIASETYYPFYKVDGKYRVGSTNGTILDNSNVEAFNDTTDALYKLLDVKAPFIYVEATEAVSNDTKMKVYFRVTANASGILGFGMTLSSNGVYKNFAPTSMNKAGQFSMTLAKSAYDQYFCGGYVIFDNNGTKTTFNNFTHKV